jgi:hypothetical protein
MSMPIARRIARQEVGGGHPSLDLNFVAGAWPAGLSFSRASGATVNAWARYGDNLVTNGDFAANVSGWNPVVAIASWVSGQMRVTVMSGGGRAEQYNLFSARKLYRVTAALSGETATACIQVVRGSSGGYSSVGLSSVVGTGATRDVSLTFASLDGEETLRVIGGSSETSGTFLVDKVVVQELTLWQPGMDWLGPELVTNGDFSNGSTGWSASGTNAQISVSSGQMTVTNGAAAEAGAVPTGSTVQIGRTYAVSCSRVGGSAGGFVVLGAQNLPINGAPGVKTGVLGPITGATGIRVATGTGTLNDAVTFDDLSIREQLYTLQTVLVPANLPRIAYDPVTGACLGAVVEPQRTNFIFPSDCKNSPGDPTFYVLAGSVNIGTVDAASLCPDGTLGPRHVSAASAAVIRSGDTSSGIYSTVYTGSVWIRTTDGSSKSCTLDVNDFTPNNFTATPIWARVSVSGQTGAGPYRFMDIALPVGEYQIWGAQLELGTEPTSYIPTSGATATRADDVLGVALSNGLAQPGTLVADVYQPTPSPPFYPGFAFKGAAGNALGVYVMPNSGVPTLLLRTGGSNLLELSLGGVSPSHRVAFAWRGSSISACASGGAVTSGSGTLPAVTTLDLGSFDNRLNGTIRRVRYYPRAMTPAELQAVTK